MNPKELQTAFKVSEAGAAILHKHFAGIDPMTTSGYQQVALEVFSAMSEALKSERKPKQPKKLLAAVK